MREGDRRGQIGQEGIGRRGEVKGRKEHEEGMLVLERRKEEDKQKEKEEENKKEDDKKEGYWLR